MDVLVDGEIMLYGTVGDDLWGEGFTARDVVDALAEIGRGNDVMVRLNSGGGYVDEGTAIYNALTAHRGRKTVVVDSIAASAASVIAMAGDEIVMRRGSLMMIHDPAMITVGDSATHQKSMEQLEAYAASIADIYAEQTGESPDKMRADMREEIWLTADDAVSRRYADRIEGEEAQQPTAFNYRAYQHAPQRLVAMTDARAWNKRPRAQAAPSAGAQQQETPMPNAQADATAAANTALQEAEARHAADLARVRIEAEQAASAKIEAGRERIKAILDSEEAKGREAQARALAFDTDIAPEKATAILAAAPKAAAGAGFTQAMAGTNPVVGPDKQAGADPEAPEAVAADVVNSFRAIPGGKQNRKG